MQKKVRGKVKLALEEKLKPSLAADFLSNRDRIHDLNIGWFSGAKK